MKASLHKYVILLATILSVVFSINYTNAQITGASAVCVNGSTALVAPSTTISGGSITNVSGYNVHTFNSGGTFVIPAGININAELLVVAAGGGGGYRHAGGGGAGGLIYNASTTITSTQTVVIGAGGIGGYTDPVNGANGGNSSLGSFVTIGGGGGGSNNIKGNDGGSGGGGSNGSFGGAGTAGQGNAGGNQNNGLGCCNPFGAGGGGYSAAGASTLPTVGSVGGAGFTTSMTGTSLSFAGGGGGGSNLTTNYAGGIGGGGMGANAINMTGGNGTSNTGGGGGGGGANGGSSGVGGVGGSGIVIVKYAQAVGNWTSSNTAVATVNASTGAVTGVSAGTATITYSVTVGGVVNNFTKVITVNGLPTATITGATNVCINTGSPLVTFTGANGTAPYTFTYNINSGTQQTVTSTGNTATVSAPTNVVGTFTYALVSVKDASSTSCSNTITASSIVVVVRAIPTISGITGTTSICTGNSTTLTAASAFVGANYKWYDAATGGNLLASGARYTTAVLSNTTNYYVELTATPFVCAATRTLVTVTVTPNNTIALSSSAGTDAQTTLLYNAIANITYTITGATGTSVTGLPTGVTAVLTGNSLVISGTPTVTGVFNYTINLSGGCGSATINGSITINQATAISNCPVTAYQQLYASATNCSAVFTYSPTFTGYPAPQISYTFSGATTGAGTGTGSGSTFNVGKTTVTITAFNSVNSSTCSFIVTVIDNIPPTALTKNITVYLDAQGKATIAASDVNNGSSDNCGTVTLSLQNTGKVCGTGNEGNNVILTAPTGAVFTSIDFASYGTPNGTCGNFTIGNCNASNSMSIVTSYLLGKNTGTVPAGNGLFGDPCGGIVKRLYIQASYKGATASATSFNCSNLGDNTVNLIVTDANGNASSAVATVTVVDNIAPTIAAPSNISAIATNSSGAVVNYTALVGTDNTSCVNTIRTAGLASGSTFPIGVSTITYTATDAAGNSTSATFTVTVSGLAPVIVVPANSSFNATANQCSAIATFAATETTGVPASTITYKENGTAISSGTALSVGVHTITATATNAVGSSSGTFTVTVKDVQAPSFNGTTSNAPASILANVPEAAQYKLVYQLNVPNTAQWSAQSQIPYTVNNAAALAGATFNRVAYYMELDNGKWVWVSMDKFTSDPSLLGIPTGSTVWQQKVNNMNVFASANAGVTTGTNIATGNIELWGHCYTQTTTLGLPGASSSTYDFDDQISSQNCYGSFQVHNYGAQQTLFAYNKWAQGGNSDLGIGNNTGNANPDWTFMYNAPSYTNKKIYVFISGGVIADINANTDLGLCAATVNVPTPAATDLCGSTTVTGVRSDALALTAAYPKGTTTITWTATDASSNATTTLQKVIVTDNEAPVIAGPSNINVIATSAAGAVVTYATPTATDNCPSVSVIKTAGLASGSTFSIGVSTITYKATDAAGLTATYTFTVTVSGVAPAIVVPANIVMNTGVGLCSAIATFTATETTGVPASIISYKENGVTVNAGSAFSVGVHTITATATNAIGSNSKTFTITVNDVTPPQFTSTASLITSNVVGVVQATSVNGAVVTYTVPTATDNCTSNPTVIAVPASGSVFPIGVSTVTVTATDVYGNSSQTTFTITVADTQIPTVLTKDITIQLDASGNAILNASQIDNGSFDNTSIQNYTIDKTSFDCSTVGSNTVTLTVVDAYGNIATGTATVTVQDNIAPQFTSGATIISTNVAGVVNATSAAGAVVNFNLPTATDNCLNNLTVTAVPASGSVFPIGNTTVTVTATDRSGNNTQTSFVVTVVGLAPVIVVPSTVTVNNTAGLCSGIASFAATETTGIPASIITYDIQPGTVFNVGTTKVTAKATNELGSSSLSFDVVVRDTELPKVITQNPTIYLDANGQATLTVAQVDNGSTDNCAIASKTISKTLFDCSNVAPTSPNASALQFNGTGSVQIPSVIPGGNNFSFSSWFFANNANNGKIISSGSFEICLCGNKIEVYTPNGGAFGAPGISLNRWHNIVVSYSFNTANVYIDGNLSFSFNAGAIGGISGAVLGRHVGGCCSLSGILDEMSFWNITLSASQIAAMQTSALKGNEAGLTAYYNFDEASGTTLIDRSGNHHNGILQGMFNPWTTVAAPITSVGSNTVILSVTDASGNIATGTASVTVLDAIAPMITCPGDISVNTDAGKCFATMTIASATATDNCSVKSIVGVRSDASSLSASYPKGITTIIWTATDASGNQSTCTQTIKVTDTEAPVIAAIADINAIATSVAGAVVNYTAAIGTDNCPGATTVMTAGLASGSTFPIGTTVVIYTVTDASGATASTSFNITVTGIAPVVVAPSNYTVNSEAGKCGASVGFAATETTGIPASTMVYTENGLPVISGTFFTVGIHTITATATNAVGTNSASFTITVNDTELPTITSPSDVAVNADNGICTASNVALGNAITADNCAVSTITNNAPTSFPVGTTTITWTVTDSHGNVSTATQNVVVTDNQAPTITAPLNVTITADAGICSSSKVNLGLPVTADNCAVASITSDAPATFSVGTTTVTWTVTDSHGNTNTATQTVTVTDDEVPVIVNTPINIRQVNDKGNCSAVITWTAATATDNCPGVTISSDHQSGETFSVGTTTVTYTATDAHAHTVTSSFTITVNDTELPRIATTDKTQTADAGVCKATVTVAAPLTNDNCAVASVTNSINGTNNASSVYPVGTTAVTWTVTDIHGNVNTTVQNITVNDDEKPIAKTQNITIQLNASGSASITPAQINNGSTDNCGIASITLDKTSFYCSNVGVNTVTLTVTDIHGNVSTATAVVTVQDKVAPLVSAKNITLGLGTAVGGLVNLTASQIDNGSTDACGIASMTVVPASFGCGNVGANTVTLTVTDVNGNVSTTTAIVTVVDDKGPVPTVATLPVITGQCYATALTLKKGEEAELEDGRIELDHYYLVVPTAMDNCSGLAKGTTTDALTYYNQGTYIIHWKYVDAKGNVTIQEQTVIVKDTYAPVPKRAVLPTLTGQCSVSIASGSNSEDDGEDNDGGDDDHGKAPWAKDNCSGWIKGTTIDPLTFNTQGTYTIHWTYNDGHGNVSTQLQTVIIKDVTKPVLKVPGNTSVSCGVVAMPGVTGMATAADNCSGAVTITYTDAVSGTSIMRTWKATDASGNYSTGVQTIGLSAAFTASISSVLTSSVYTGGVSTNLYLGYGAQSTTLQVGGLPAGGAPYSYGWTAAKGTSISTLNSTTSGAPVFTATTSGVSSFTVTVTNKNGCSATATISICVTDIRVSGTGGTKVWISHSSNGKGGDLKSLSVLVGGVAAHLLNDKGDRLGSTDQQPCSQNAASAVDPTLVQEVMLSKKMTEETVGKSDELNVVVMPNPSTSYFTLKLSSKDKSGVNMRVMDASGRAIEAKQQLDPNSTIQIGYSYPSGTFYAEMIQGNKRKVVQLIKARG